MDLRTGVCPLCQGSAVSMIDGASFRGANRIAAGSFLVVSLNRYVCICCGYTQEFVEDPEALKRIAARWPRVLPEAGQE